MTKSMISRLVTLAGLTLGAALVAACSAAPTESTQTSEGPLKCSYGDPTCGIGTGGGGGGTGGCDPNAECCWIGKQSMTASDCGAVLYNNGCRSITGNGTAYTIERDGYGHWWFEAFCPWSAYNAATQQVCESAGVMFNAGGQCTHSASSGQFEVAYDPNCPSGCKFSNY